MEKVAFRKTYRLRAPAQQGKNSIEFTFPWDVVDRQARLHEMSIEEFCEKYQVVASYGGDFDGVIYTFQEIPDDGKKTK